MNPRTLIILLCGCPLLAVFGCTDHGQSPTERAAPHYGTLMHEVGQRFELMGRAAAARRWELAAFELSELEEVFEDLSSARRPEITREVDLAALQAAFLNTHPPELRIALERKDPAALEAAFARTAATCNGCHRATGHAFIEIPSQPGATVPRLDSVP